MLAAIMLHQTCTAAVGRLALWGRLKRFKQHPKQEYAPQAESSDLELARARHVGKNHVIKPRSGEALPGSSDPHHRPF